MSKSYYRQIALVPLGPEAIGEMLEDLLGSDPSLAELPEMLRERTGGNPFFIEEVVRSLVEAGNLEGERGAYRLARPVEEAVVPASVQVVLSARIDRLDAAREGGAPGRRGDRQGVPRVGAGRGRRSSSETELEDALRELVAGGFVYEQEIYPESIYAFKHPLTQEVAYSSQLGDRRAADHAAVARALAEQSPERLDELAALLAQHWEAAGEDARGGALARPRRELEWDTGPDRVAPSLAEGLRADRGAAGLRGDDGAGPRGQVLPAPVRLAARHDP